ncbi:fumarylacetoacetate hydrolase family protein [Gracilibacillus sp. HCP3S3_G5_1]|uniref:fumarylacetoacetate hydrolase family protein n=1 Tax=unclassified Gracilibacillus TaxID=2625209 RepID=UPI003F8ABEE1
MRLATIAHEGEEKAAIIHNDRYFLIETLNEIENKSWPVTVFDLIEGNQLKQLESWYRTDGIEVLNNAYGFDADTVDPAPLYRRPRKIWGIGMNYTDPTEQSLADVPYTDPVSFMKPDTTIIGSDDKIMIPKNSTNTTAEAELAIIIGQECRDVKEEEAAELIAGFAVALDMTESDIHAENHRYLTRAKSFDTFFSFGSELVTKAEVEEVGELTVSTIHNGQLAYQNQVKNMRYSPSFIVSFHSKVMTLLPGDIILTGTPGKVTLRDQDDIQADISGFRSLKNQVQQK